MVGGNDCGLPFESLRALSIVEGRISDCGVNGIPHIRPGETGAHMRALTACTRGVKGERRTARGRKESGGPVGRRSSGFFFLRGRNGTRLNVPARGNGTRSPSGRG